MHEIEHSLRAYGIAKRIFVNIEICRKDISEGRRIHGFQRHDKIEVPRHPRPAIISQSE